MNFDSIVSDSVSKIDEEGAENATHPTTTDAGPALEAPKSSVMTTGKLSDWLQTVPAPQKDPQATGTSPTASNASTRPNAIQRTPNSRPNVLTAPSNRSLPNSLASAPISAPLPAPPSPVLVRSSAMPSNGPVHANGQYAPWMNKMNDVPTELEKANTGTSSSRPLPASMQQSRPTTVNAGFNSSNTNFMSNNNNNSASKNGVVPVPDSPDKKPMNKTTVKIDVSSPNLGKKSTLLNRVLQQSTLIAVEDSPEKPVPDWSQYRYKGPGASTENDASALPPLPLLHVGRPNSTNWQKTVKSDENARMPTVQRGRAPPKKRQTQATTQKKKKRGVWDHGSSDEDSFIVADGEESAYSAEDEESDEDSDEDSSRRKRAKTSTSTSASRSTRATRSGSAGALTSSRTSKNSQSARESSFFGARASSIDLAEEDDETGISTANIIMSGSRRETRALAESAKLAAREERRNGTATAKSRKKIADLSEEEADDDESDVEEDEESEGSSTDDGESDSESGGGKRKTRAGGGGARAQKIPKLQQLLNICDRKFEKLSEILASSGIEYEKLKDTNVAITLRLDQAQPETLAKHCKLTQYQMVGLNWLYLLHQGNLNGILADEMGLGKTLQTISLFTLLKEKNVSGPHLVVVPTSTLLQWGNELRRWSPTLDFVSYAGSMAEREDIRRQYKKQKRKGEESFPDIVLTTYQLIGGKHDKKWFKNIDWNYMVLDEAQNIKNGKSQRFASLFKIKSKRRLLLTGTPLQNNLQELWALLHFLLPSEFDQFRLENYSEVFREYLKKTKKDEKRHKHSDEDEYIQKVKKILEPFILRRLKEEVTKDLPAKHHIRKLCALTQVQRALYSQIYLQSKTLWKENGKQSGNVVDESGRTVSLHSFLNNLLMQLRKIGNHPLLLRVYFDDEKIQKIAKILKAKDAHYKKDRKDDIAHDLSVISDWELHHICVSRQKQIPELASFALANEQLYDLSGKMNRLAIILKRLKENGNRVLVFSQMTKMMNILGAFFDELGYTYLRLDGSTPVTDRQMLIDKYNKNNKFFIFLLSTRAGGLGINLSTADTVIFYDISFNPQVDRQAEDRCHRLGQKKQVNVITLITKDTCEQQIWEMAQEKKELNDIILREGEFSAEAQAQKQRKKALEEQDENPAPSLQEHLKQSTGSAPVTSLSILDGDDDAPILIGNQSIDTVIEEKEEEIATDQSMMNVLSNLFEDVGPRSPTKQRVKTNLEFDGNGMDIEGEKRLDENNSMDVVSQIVSEIEQLLEHDEEESRVSAVSQLISERKARLADFDDKDVYDSEGDDKKESSSGEETTSDLSEELTVVRGGKNGAASKKSSAEKKKVQTIALSSSSSEESEPASDSSDESASETSSVDSDSDSFDLGKSTGKISKTRKSDNNSFQIKPVLRTRKSSALQKENSAVKASSEAKTFEQKIQEREEKKKKQADLSRRKVVAMAEEEEADDANETSVRDRSDNTRVELNSMEVEIAKSAGESWRKKSSEIVNTSNKSAVIEIDSSPNEEKAEVTEIPQFAISDDEED